MFRVTLIRRSAAALLLMAPLLQPLLTLAGESRIELSDGTVIAGELIAIEGGRYRIHSSTLGDLSVSESSIRSLQPLTQGAEQSASDTTASHAADIANIQKQLITDQGLMEQITALQQDPEIQSVLSDPGLTRMILSGDVEALRSDPRIQQLMSNPSIQAIMRQVIGQ